MTGQFSHLAFDGGPLTVSVFELRCGLTLTRGLEQGFMIIQDNRAPVRCAAHTAFEQWASLAHRALKEEGWDAPAKVVMAGALVGSRLAVRTSDGSRRQVDRKGRLGQVGLGGHGQGRDQTPCRAPGRPRGYRRCHMLRPR